MVKHIMLNILFFCLALGSVQAQMAENGRGLDSDQPEYLLLNKGLQFRITEAVNSLYNFDFETAERGFQMMGYTYPDHPLPSFLMGLSQWWKIAPDTQNEKYDGIFLKYMEEAIKKALAL